MAILPKDMDMHGKKAFPITEMANQPFVISAEGVDYDIHQVLKETGIEPDIRFSSMDDHVVISMVANNLGISMLQILPSETHEPRFRHCLWNPIFPENLVSVSVPMPVSLLLHSSSSLPFRNI